MPRISVCFFCDRAALPGLHVTLLSLLESHRGDEALRLLLFSASLSTRDLSLLRSTFDSARRGDERLEIRPFEGRPARGANSLHGNFTAYGRLSLADLLPEEKRVVYLDCDLIVTRSLAPLVAEAGGERVLRVDGGGKRGGSLDRDLYLRAGLDLDGDCFNSGVMGIDLDLWRRRGCSARCREVVRRYAGMFRSADQAVLNVALADEFTPLGSDINYPLYPDSPALIAPFEGRIYHFLGSPKPWDLFGSILHTNHGLWSSYYQRTAIGSHSPLRYLSARRAVRISRATLSLCGRRLRQRRLRAQSVRSHT